MFILFKRMKSIAGQQRCNILSVLLLVLAMLSGMDCNAQRRPAITGIAFVRVTSAEMKSSQNFYQKTLGFEADTSPDSILRYHVNELQWFEVVPLKVAPEAGRLAAVGLATRNVVAMEAYLRAHKIAIEIPIHHQSFAVRDPEGNLIYFVQQHLVPVGKSLSHAPSDRLIHTGFVVRDRAAEDSFYRDLLGFHLYWEGGMKEGDSDWVNMQVPDGTDCVEYMLHQAVHPSIKQLGIMNHFALGVAQITTAAEQIKQNGCASGAMCQEPHMGREGKMGMNLYDPDGTRVELMEFQPTGKNFGAPFTGRHQSEKEDR
jgi:catechol 2,3-dioxygenase-like lactoylglutathione lyase family enzyme